MEMIDIRSTLESKALPKKLLPMLARITKVSIVAFTATYAMRWAATLASISESARDAKSILLLFDCQKKDWAEHKAKCKPAGSGSSDKKSNNKKKKGKKRR